MFALNNILANTHFSVNSVIEFNIEIVMKSNTDHINFTMSFHNLTGSDKILCVLC